MSSEAIKSRPIREIFKRSGNFYKIPFSEVVDVVLAQEAQEGPLSEVVFRPLVIEHAERLKTMIRSGGFKKNHWPELTYFNGKLYVEKGNHRVWALRELAKEGWDGLDEVLFTMSDPNRTKETRIFEIFTDNVQQNLGMDVQAKVIYDLYEINNDKKRIADRLGISVQTVDNMLEYHTQLPDELKAAVVDGKVSASTALATFREEGRDGEAAKKRLAEAFEAAIAEQAAKVAAKKVKKGEEGKKAKVTEKHLKATRKVVSIPDDYASLIPQQAGSMEDILEHLRDLTEVANRALKVLKTVADDLAKDEATTLLSSQADEVAFELDSLLERGSRKGYAKTEEAAEAAE
jgi:hypothetical protein